MGRVWRGLLGEMMTVWALVEIGLAWAVMVRQRRDQLRVQVEVVESVSSAAMD
jgi:hypothetical protein